MYASQEVQGSRFRIHSPIQETYTWGKFWISGDPKNLRIRGEAGGRVLAPNETETLPERK